jgi:hypothetical protein
VDRRVDPPSDSRDSQEEPVTDSTSSTHPVAELQYRWIFRWDRTEGDPEFSFERNLADLYDFDADDLILYDDFEPGHRVARTAREYGTFWNEPFNSLRRARHSVVDGPSVVVSDDIAASRMVFIAALEPGGGEPIGIRATTSSVWRNTPQGWRIFREHTSTVKIPIEEADDLVDHPEHYDRAVAPRSDA